MMTRDTMQVTSSMAFPTHWPAWASSSSVIHPTPIFGSGAQGSERKHLLRGWKGFVKLPLAFEVMLGPTSCDTGGATYSESWIFQSYSTAALLSLSHRK